MTWNMDDPRWTAYVLDELDAADREELEAVLAGDDEARAYVASLRETIDALERELGAQPAPAALDELQRKRIHSAVVRRSRRGVWIASALVASTAAGVALVVVSSSQVASFDAQDKATVSIPEPVLAQKPGQVGWQLKGKHEEDGQNLEHNIHHNT